MNEIRVHITARLESDDGPRGLVADVRVEYTPRSGGDLDVFAELSELPVDDVATDESGDVPDSVDEGLNGRRNPGRVPVSPLSDPEPVVGEDDPHRRSLYRAGPD